MKRFVSIFVVFILLFSLTACSDTTVRGSVVRESTYGNAELDIMPQKLLEKVNVGDIVDCYVDEIFLDKNKVALSLIEPN